MADQPIGISFIPSAQNAANGPTALRADGGLGSGSTDLQAAYKILSLRLPTVVGANAPTPVSNLTSTGAAALPSGLSPHAAVFQALLKALMTGDDSGVDKNALAGFGAMSQSSSVGADPNAMGAGSDLPGAMTPPPPRNAPAIRVPQQFPSEDPVDSAPVDRPWLTGPDNSREPSY